VTSVYFICAVIVLCFVNSYFLVILIVTVIVSKAFSWSPVTWKTGEFKEGQETVG